MPRPEDPLWRPVAWGRVLSREWQILLLLAVVAGALWFFAVLASEVMEGETHAFDVRLLLAFRNPADPSDPLGPRWFEEVMRDFTSLGSNAILTLVTAAVAGFLLIARQRGAAVMLLISVAMGSLLGTLLKSGFDRPRPDLVPSDIYVHSASFPSGHSMMSAIVYLTLGAWLARMQPRRRLKAYVLAVAVLLTVIVGISRVYLGVHWPTDVLGGWAVGAAWALLCWLVSYRLQRGGSIGPERADDQEAPP
jgi:undecaprenyl-diphosphatase